MNVSCFEAVERVLHRNSQPRSGAEFHAYGGHEKARCGRYVNSNHKTGSHLAHCLVSLLRSRNTSVCVGSSHVTHGFTPAALSLNLVRNPFDMVVSGYEYHRNAAQPEGWTLARTTAARAYVHGRCMPGAEAGPVLSDSTGYRAALHVLGTSQGLLLESVRMLESDLPGMLSAAQSCREAEAAARAALDVAVSGTPHSYHGAGAAGGCVNMLLDDAMADYGATWLRVVGALRLDASMAAAGAFAATCDPTSMHTEHATNRTGRASVIELLWHLDAEHLGSRLRTAEGALAATLSPRVGGKPPHVHQASI